ncbi:unnamed protein product, partial [Soboliphyme baturini]|uniref:diacylglycerol O-acyltransferase n=1 Tax=Soboliphyme baturini TaxID=241478 RepID=A0A183J116_9BILA
MTKILGIDFAPVFVPLHRRLETLAVLHFVFIFFSPYFTYVLAFYLLFYTRFWWLPLLYLGWFYVDKDYLADFFPIRLVKTAELDPNRNYIFGYHPHGIMGFGAFVNFATEATGFSSKFPGITSRLCTLVGQFWFPLRREYIISAGTKRIRSRESIKWILQRPVPGQAVVIVIGGAIEALNAHPGSHTVVLSNRHGFVRAALVYGADLVPVFCFGENDVYFQYRNPEGSFLRYLQFFGWSPPIIFGRAALRCVLVNCAISVGKPIRVNQCFNPTEEQI